MLGLGEFISVRTARAMSNGRLNNRLLVWFSLGHLAIDWAPCAIWLIAPAIGVAMELSPGEVGLLIAIASFGAALGYLPAGVLADRVARRGRLMVGTFWWVAIGYAVASLAPGFWSVALLLALAGLGDAAWHPIATGVLAQALPARRAQALGIHAMGGSFAEVLAPLAVGFLLVYVDWRTAMLISALPAALMGIAFLRVSAAVPASPQAALSWTDLRDLWQAWRSPQGLGMAVMIGVSNMAFMAILAMAPLLLQRVHGLSPAETGLAFSVMVLAGALVQPLIGRLSDGTGRKPLIIAGNLAAVAACLAVAVSTAPGAAIAALVAAVTALAGIRSVILVSVVEFAGQRESTTLGLAFVLLDGIGALGAVLAGTLGNLDLHYAFILAAGFAAGAGAMAVPLAFRAKTAPAAPLPDSAL